MSKCDVSVLIDDEQRNFVIGDTVRGTVRINVNAQCDCKKLTVVLQWRTHGRGNCTSGDVNETPDILFQGKWSPGRYEYPFEFVLPEGPLSYHGHLLNVDWYVHARADIPWAIDPKGDAELILERGDYDGELLIGEPDMLEAQQIVIGSGETPTAAIGCVLLFLAPFFLVGFGAIAGGITKLVQGKPEGLFILGFGIVFSIVPTLIMLAMFWRKAAERKLGKVDVNVEPTDARPGDTVWCAVNFRPQKDVKVASITASLVGEEVVVSGSGTNSTTHTHKLFEQKHELLAQRHISAGKEVSLDVELTIPDDAAPTFRAYSNRLKWAVNVHVDIPKWPDWDGNEHVKIG
jgi:hypothetical protein